jgi:hypothetical protein
MTDRLLSRCYHSTDYVPLTRETVRTPVIRSSAHTIMTAKEAMIKIVKQYRVLYRSADGCATYIAVISEGSELLRISPDGPPQYNVIEGVSLADAFGAGLIAPSPRSRTPPLSMWSPGTPHSSMWSPCGLSNRNLYRSQNRNLYRTQSRTWKQQSSQHSVSAACRTMTPCCSEWRITG